MRKFYIILTLFGLCTLNAEVRAQRPGLEDDFLSSGGVSQRVWDIAEQDDGKILIVGGFNSYNNINTNFIARLEEDGTLDESFDIGEGANTEIFTVCVQPNGKILIGGGFLQFNGFERRRIARLNADGSVDETFDTSSGIEGSHVNSIVVQSDGKILVGGSFFAYNGTNTYNLIRLNEDGSVDESFETGEFLNGDVATIALDEDEHILIGGWFTEYDGVERNRIARLNPDGTLDESFDPGDGANDAVHAIYVQPDESILIGGYFTEYDGFESSKLARVLPDGFFDESFDVGLGGDPGGAVFAIDVLDDETILAAGNFISFGDNTLSNNIQGIVRLYDDGSLYDTYFDNPDLEPTFNFIDILDDEDIERLGVRALVVRASGTVLVGGLFLHYKFRDVAWFFEINELGGFEDIIFNNLPGSDEVIEDVALLSDGKIIIVGDFDTYNDIERHKIARLLPSGALDMDFLPGTGANAKIRSVAVQEDGKILIGGDFTEYDGFSCNYLARLHADGSFDESFQIGFGADDLIKVVKIQDGEKILVGGEFTYFDDVFNSKIARLNEEGSLDQEFFTGDGPVRSIEDIEPLEDGRILVAGNFLEFDGVASKRIARLNYDGTVDNSFRTISGANRVIYDILQQPDGKILIGGEFTLYDGQDRAGIARLNQNGSLDDLFNPGFGIDYDISGTTRRPAVYSIALQSDGKVVLGGFFDSYNSSFGSFGIVRTNPNGSWESEFDPPGLDFGSDHFINKLLLQPNGRVILAGNFTFFNENPQGNITRIYCAVPQIPEYFVADEPNDSTFTLFWDKVPGIDKYEVDVSRSEAFNNFIPGYLNRFTTDDFVLVEGIEPGEQYFCRVRAINEQGASPNTNTLEVITVPSTPNDFSVEAISSREIIAQWEFIPGNFYLLEIAADSLILENDTIRNFESPLILASGQYTHQNLDPKRTYFYRISAVKNGVSSEPSEIVGATTLTDIITTNEPVFSKEFVAYPNPGFKQIKLSLPKIKVEQIKLFNANGVIVQTKTLSSQSEEQVISIQNLPSGVYFIQIHLEQGQQLIKKIIKP